MITLFSWCPPLSRIHPICFVVLYMAYSSIAGENASFVVHMMSPLEILKKGFLKIRLERYSDHVGIIGAPLRGIYIYIHIYIYIYIYRGYCLETLFGNESCLA